MAQIEVYPQKNGEWRVRRRGEGDKSESLGKGLETRREAVDIAMAERQHGERVALLRPDGSEYGELHHAESGADAHNVGIEPVGESGEAV